MEDGKPDQPPSRATHWNVKRDPVESFSCPRCGSKVQLGVVYRPPDHFPDMLASCEICQIALHSRDWQAALLRKWRREG